MCSFVHLLLGDAYLRVEKPDQAIKVYESVLRWEPSNLLLASKMGEALVMTHEFERAVLYYESALTQVSCVGRSPLLPDFTVLLIRLKQLEKTEVLLKSGLESIKNCKSKFLTIPVVLRNQLLTFFHFPSSTASFN